MGEPTSSGVSQSLLRLGFEVAVQDAPALGIVLSEKTPAEIANVVDDSPAGASGIAPLDLIERIDGFPFSAKGLAWAATREGKVALAVKRGGRQLTFEMSPAVRRRIGALFWKGSEAQAKRVRALTGREDFAPARGEAIPLASFENFHGIQRVV